MPRVISRRAVGPIQQPVPVRRTEYELLVVGLGREPHLDLDHETRGPVGVERPQRVALLHAQQPGLFLAGHHGHRLDVVTGVDAAPRDGADPAGSAAEKPADRALDPGRREAPELPARRPGHSLDGAEPRSGLGPHYSSGHRVDAIETRHIDHHTAVERNALTVVPGARTPRNNRHPGTETEPYHRAQLIDRAGTHRQVSPLAVQLAAQDRGIPKEVLRKPRQGLVAVDHMLGAEQGT